jgi:hypothetical protein
MYPLLGPAKPIPVTTPCWRSLLIWKKMQPPLDDEIVEQTTYSSAEYHYPEEDTRTKQREEHSTKRGHPCYKTIIPSVDKYKDKWSMTAKFNEISQKRISLKEKHMPFLPHMR